MIELYESQRAMRNMRKAAMHRGVVAVLDVGSAQISCFVLRFDGATPRADGGQGVGSMAGQTGFRVIGEAVTRSRGVHLGEIQTMRETERAIRTAIQNAQKKAGIRVDHVIACFSGGAPRSYGVVGDVEIQTPQVVEYDVARALSACDVPDFGAGREVLHAQPVNFALDHRSGLRDPRGQTGRRLAVDMHMLTVNGDMIRNLVQCVRRCDLELAGVASSSYVSGVSALVEDEQELGAACIDMGAGSTGISLFLRKHMIYADSVRLGGAHITADISMGLRVPEIRAEQIKTVHGGVLATGRDDCEMIAIGGQSGDYHHDSRSVSRTELIGIMRPRVEEILEAVRGRLDAAGFEHLPSQQIVLTGAGSQIPGLDGLATRILGRQVRLGRPLRVGGQPHETTGPEFSALVGLCLLAANPQDEWWDFEIPDERYPARSLKRAVRWFRENW